MCEKHDGSASGLTNVRWPCSLKPPGSRCQFCFVLFFPEWLHAALHGSTGESFGCGAVLIGQRLQSEHRHRGKSTHTHRTASHHRRCERPATTIIANQYADLLTAGSRLLQFHYAPLEVMMSHCGSSAQLMPTSTN